LGEVEERNFLSKFFGKTRKWMIKKVYQNL
jgi:hypothetical protein